MQSSIVQEEDNKDESASGNVGHGKEAADMPLTSVSAREFMPKADPVSSRLSNWR